MSKNKRIAIILGILCIACVCTITVYSTDRVEKEHTVDTVTHEVERYMNEYISAPEMQYAIKELTKEQADTTLQEITNTVSSLVMAELNEQQFDVDALQEQIEMKLSESLPSLDTDNLSTAITNLVIDTLQNYEEQWYENMNAFHTEINVSMDTRFEEYSNEITRVNNTLNTLNNSYNSLNAYITNNNINSTELAVLTTELESLRKTIEQLSLDLENMSIAYTTLNTVCEERYTQYLVDTQELNTKIDNQNALIQEMYTSCKQDLTKIENTFNVKLTQLGNDIYNNLTTIGKDYGVVITSLDQKLTTDIITGDSTLNQRVDANDNKQSDNLTQAKDELQNNVDINDEKQSDNLTQAKDELQTSIDTNDNKQSDNLSDTKEELQNNVDTNDEKQSNNLSTTKEELQASIDANDNKQSDNLTQSSNELHNSIGNLETETKENIVTVRDLLSQRIGDLDTLTTNNLSKLQNATKEEDLKLNNRIDLTTTELTDHLVLLQQQVSVDVANAIEQTNNTINKLSTKTSADINSLNATLNDVVNTQIANVRNDMTTLSTTINNALLTTNDTISTGLLKVDGDLSTLQGVVDSNNLATTQQLDKLNKDLTDCFQSVSSGKNLLASTLLTKGVPLTKDATFDQIAEGILSIETTVTIENMPGEIEYTYHNHTGSASSCGGCYTQALYHYHNGNCYRNRVCGSHSGGDSGYPYFNCTTCGHGPHKGGHHNCGVVVGTEKVCSQSSGAFLGYGLSCGLKDGQIVSATIKYPGYVKSTQELPEIKSNEELIIE